MNDNMSVVRKKGNMIIALALMKHLYNEGKIPEHVYKNIKKEYIKKIEST